MSKSPQDISADHLAPIRAWVRANRGSINGLAAMMAERSGCKVNRHMVARWLHDDPKIRIQPTHGYAILIEECVRELQEQQQEK